MPGPYLLTRSMWLAPLSEKAYPNKEALGKDVVNILKREIDELCAHGVSVIQFDEPVLTEVVFTEGKPRSFMCAALSEKKDPKEELAFASGLISEVIQHVDATKATAALHVCRGNWSKDESTLLTGPYTALLPIFEASAPPFLILEFSTPRAGELSSLFASEVIANQSGLGLGVINPRTDTIETVDSIIERTKEALTWLPKEKIWLNPDCGFATFSNQPVNQLAIVEQKTRHLTKAAYKLRQLYGK